jgi:hypothetical protein
MDRQDDQVDGIEVGDDGIGADTVPEIVPPALTVAYARGVNPGKWARIWSERRPDDELRLIRVDLDEQRAVLASGAADVVLARVPIDQDGLNTIALFEELPVVVFAKGAALGAEDTVGMAALADEQLIMTPLVLEWAERTAVLGFDAPAAPLTDDPEAAVELAASEVGIVVVPQSVARLHQRKDVEYRPIHRSRSYWSGRRTARTTPWRSSSASSADARPTARDGPPRPSRPPLLHRSRPRDDGRRRRPVRPRAPPPGRAEAPSSPRARPSRRNSRGNAARSARAADPSSRFRPAREGT